MGQAKQVDDKQRTGLQQATVTPGGKEMEPQEVQSGKAAEVQSSKEVEVIPESPEIEELEGYVEKVEKAAELATPVTDDYTQQVLMSSVNQQNVVVTLPLTADEIKKGLHHQVWEGVRWLAEWCVRVIKMMHGRVRFKKS